MFLHNPWQIKLPVLDAHRVQITRLYLKYSKDAMWMRTSVVSAHHQWLQMIPEIGHLVVRVPDCPEGYREKWQTCLSQKQFAVSKWHHAYLHCKGTFIAHNFPVHGLSTFFKYCKRWKAGRGFGTRLIYMYIHEAQHHSGLHVIIRKHVTSNQLLEEDQNVWLILRLSYISRCTEGLLLNQLTCMTTEWTVYYDIEGTLVHVYQALPLSLHYLWGWEKRAFLTYLNIKS